MRLARACLVPLCMLLLGGCSPVVEAKFSDIEVTRPDIAVPGAGTSGLSSVMFSFSFDSTKLGANSNLEAQSGIVSVKLHKLDLNAKGGVTDLSFIETLHAFAFVPRMLPPHNNLRSHLNLPVSRQSPIPLQTLGLS